MSRATSAELLPVLRERYGRRGRAARSGMLDEFCEQFGCIRKHAIKVLRAKLPPPCGRPRPGPVRVYDADVLRVTKALWLASDQLCGKRLARRRRRGRRGLCGTKPGSLLRTQIASALRRCPSGKGSALWLSRSARLPSTTKPGT